VNFEAVYKCTVGGCRENVPSSFVTSSIHTGYSHIISYHDISYQQCVDNLSNLWDARYGLCSVVSVMSTPVHSSRPIPSPVLCHSPPFPGTAPCLPFPLYCIDIIDTDMTFMESNRFLPLACHHMRDDISTLK
jgi:hypothetical protein